MFRRSLALAAALTMIGVTAPGMAQPAPTVQVNAPRKAKRALFGGYHGYSPMTYGRKGAGVTMAQQQRAAKKARNVKRHKRSVRG